MTLQELWMIIVRRWKLVVAVTLVCAVAGGGYYMVAKHGPESYAATAYVVANSQVSGVSGLADDEARKLAAASEGEGVEVKVEADSKMMTVKITATGGDPDACVEVANAVSKAANASAEKAYSNWETPYSGSVTDAVEAEAESSGNLLKYLLVALLGGLFVSICIVVALDMMRRSVKTPESVQEAVELPVLEILPAKNGERLLANVRFAFADAAKEADGQVASVLVVPSGDAATANGACELLQTAAAAEDATLDAQQAEPLSEGMAGAYAAREVDAVIVTARQWIDTMPQLESTVAELRLAGANLAGIVFAKEKLA